MLTLELSEINSLTEERYSLNLKSARCVLEGTLSRREIKEAMIHHHPRGHPWKHLQFKLLHQHEVIRIRLDLMDEEDYNRCIKGFLHLSQDVISYAREENNIQTEVISYFFNDKIGELESNRLFLLNKIRAAFEKGYILDDSNRSINKIKLEQLKSEKHLLPFLKWD
ncbi:hypothetical protein HZC30_08065 [Candidatus Woesearchaeota archaeon]|nr:hypothetical protein [Candidatus Woesearchaeota archaeon]